MKFHSLFLIGLLLLTKISQADELPSHTNIIYLMTDDQRWDSFGCYGRPEFRTKNIDQLAREGVIFDNAHHAVAICTPSRATVMTGRYFASHKAGFTYPFRETIPAEEFNDSYHAVLKKAGYRSGFIGKYDVPVSGGGRAHFDFFALRDRYEMPKNDPVMDQIYREDRDPKERTLIKGDAMLHFLDTQPKDQPFVLSVSFDAVKNDKDSDMYGPDTEVFDGQTMSIPGNWVEGPNRELPEVIQKYARGVRLHPQNCGTPELYQKLARRFATQGVSVDNQVGRLMEKLKELNFHENTIIIYTSDNGRFHGSHGMFDKCLLYEEATKAPLIIWDGRKSAEEKGFRVEELVSSTDFAPTILDLTGQDIPASMQGEALTPLLEKEGKAENWREAVLMENLFIEEMFTVRLKKGDEEAANKELLANNRSYRSRGVRTKRYKYFSYFEHKPVIEELYDLQNDPLEVNNLAQDPAHAETLTKLRKTTEELFNQYKKE